MEPLPQKKLRGNATDESSTEECTKISEKCSNQGLTYDVLRIIFKYLNGMELSNAAMVCRSWLEAANNEKQTRGPTYLIEYCKMQCSRERVKTKIIKNLRIKPVLGLFFTSTFVPFIKKDCHCKVLPPNCDTVTLGTYGIIIDSTEIENSSEEIVCACLPEIPGVTIKTFAIGDNSTKKYDISQSVKKYSRDIKEFLSTPENNSGTSKCLLLFSDLRGRSSAIQISNSLKRRYAADELSVWGGVATDLLVCNSKDSKNNKCRNFAICVVALIGSVDSWSIVVDKSYKTRERIEQRLKSFKNRICLKKHSMGFMFACCARGERMFDVCNAESTIFKQLFPEVPLVGCFGDGEFGVNSLPSVSSRKKKNLYNEMTTVFLIITYG
ncbi:F-box only protein 22-like [Colletes latitarsis]|uniref:F-box only protein 22-like n=1 Tax=Colletes latitarsis TaxID=2605962 RepID=UPI00403713DF